VRSQPTIFFQKTASETCFRDSMHGHVCFVRPTQHDINISSPGFYQTNNNNLSVHSDHTARSTSVVTQHTSSVHAREAHFSGVSTSTVKLFVAPRGYDLYKLSNTYHETTNPTRLRRDMCEYRANKSNMQVRGQQIRHSLRHARFNNNLVTSHSSTTRSLGSDHQFSSR
jgi:hypothetical protein